jgi:hypothetical protein
MMNRKVYGRKKHVYREVRITTKDLTEDDRSPEPKLEVVTSRIAE